jgi:hypothetical protein
VVEGPLRSQDALAERAATTVPGLRAWQRFGVAIPYVWLLVFFLAPFLMVLKISLAGPSWPSRPTRRSSMPGREAAGSNSPSTTTASCSATGSTC